VAPKYEPLISDEEIASFRTVIRSMQGRPQLNEEPDSILWRTDVSSISAVLLPHQSFLCAFCSTAFLSHHELTLHIQQIHSSPGL
jgi:hypothetical protein